MVFYYDNAIKYLYILQKEDKTGSWLEGGWHEFRQDKGRIRSLSHLLSALSFRKTRKARDRCAETHINIDSQASRALAAAVLVLASLVSIAYADDSELCMQHCNDQKIEDLSQALEIWNAANCSVRDICTPAQLKATCQPDDETYNITKMCDPDDSDTCFATQALADKYIKEFGNDSDVHIPCPPSQAPYGDESGK